MDKAQFGVLVFSRQRPENFEQILRFDAMPRLTKENRQHLFLSGLTLHALDAAQTYKDLLPSKLLDAEFDVREVVRHLSLYLTTISYSSAYVHSSICFLSTEFNLSQIQIEIEIVNLRQELNYSIEKMIHFICKMNTFLKVK